jgi:CDP-6-deoxy-D-xylo-4-hexulose-3-dehydrase
VHRDSAAVQKPTRSREDISRAIAGLVSEYFAIDEGDPESVDCPLAVPLYGAEEVNGAVEVLLSQRVTMGARTREFERQFAAYVGSEHAVMVNSGSSANLLAVSILADTMTQDGLRPGDEVIVPAVTWATTVTPILQAGCVPVFVDVDPETLNLRPEDLEAALSPRTRAIFAVHLLGNPVRMPDVVDFARERGLWVLEDTCESLGSSYDGRYVGTFGDVGTYSFYFSHHITTIEGGMLVTDDGRLADLARSMRAHGWSRDMSTRQRLEAENAEIDPRFLFVHLGYNLRPTELSAAFGSVQLERLEGFNAARHENAQRLLDALGDLDDELSFVREQPGGRSTWFSFAVLTRDIETRQALTRHLEERQIQTRPIVAGNLALQPAFRDTPHRSVGELPVATEIGRRGLLVGNHPDLGDRRVAHIGAAFRSFFGR